MLDATTHTTDIRHGDTILRFAKRDDQSNVTLQLIPAALADQVQPYREIDGIEVEVLSGDWKGRSGYQPENCVQLKMRGDAGPNAFCQGRTMRAGPACDALRFESQTIEEAKGATTVRTMMTGQIDDRSFRTTLVLEWPDGAPYFTARTTCENVGETPITLEMLSSFCLDGMTPFHPGSAPERLRLHRFRSIWSLEGRHEAPLVEDLHLERSWAGYGIFSERYGQLGSMPVRGFFPFGAVEDTEAGVFWGAQLALPGSWQIELFRRSDKVSLSGGLADREFGHWFKTLAPSESFTSAEATIACVQGTLEDLTHALLARQEAARLELPGEDDLPIIFNEWCASWGNPTEKDVVATADALTGTPTRYLVIDDGWAEKPGPGIQQNGDWKLNTTAFPNGLKAACDAIRERGLVPGIWFEFEVCNSGSEAFKQTEHHLTRDGLPLEIGTRRFWDFRDPWVVDYLSERVIALLRDNGFGYLKVDYNETLGLGCDESQPQANTLAPNSLGEGLRQHLEGVQAFFRKIHDELPDLLIENCSSGGHRLEPSMQALCAMGSFSDAHETVEIPIISASLQYLILPRQSQVWAVIKPTDSLQRVRYSLCSTFLGRQCISGNVKDMNADQFAVLKEGQELYVRAAPVIRDGQSKVIREMNKAWRTPKGWQAVVRTGLGDASGKALVVLHRFADAPASVNIPLPEGSWRVAGSFGSTDSETIPGQTLTANASGEYTGHVWLLEKA